MSDIAEVISRSSLLPVAARVVTRIIAPASGANPPVKMDRKRKSNKEKTFTVLNPWEQDDAYSATPSPSTVDDQEVCKSWGHRINNIDGSCVCDLSGTIHGLEARPGRVGIGPPR